MITSVGGKNANPFMGPYCASKFAMEGLSESLRRELMLFGIDVIVVAPGAVATPIWAKAEEVDVTQYANTPYMTQLQKIRSYMLDRGPKGLKPEKLGEAIHHALTTPNPKVRYTVSPDGLQDLMVSDPAQAHGGQDDRRTTGADAEERLTARRFVRTLCTYFRNRNILGNWNKLNETENTK